MLHYPVMLHCQVVVLCWWTRNVQKHLLQQKSYMQCFHYFSIIDVITRQLKVQNIHTLCVLNTGHYMSQLHIQCKKAFINIYKEMTSYMKPSFLLWLVELFHTDLSSICQRKSELLLPHHFHFVTRCSFQLTWNKCHGQSYSVSNLHELGSRIL